MRASLNRIIVAIVAAVLLWCATGSSLSAAEKYLVYLSPMPFSDATQPNMTGKGSGSATLEADTLSISAGFSGLASAAVKGHLSLSKAAGIPGTALFDLTVQHEVRSLTEHLFRAYETGEGFSVKGSIRAGVEATIDYAKRRPDGFRLLFQTGFTSGQGATPAWEEVRGVLIDRNAELVLRRLDALRAPGGIVAARMLSAAIVGASEHVARLIADDTSVDPAAAADALTELLTVGLTGLSRPALAALDRASGTGRERARR